MRKQGILSDISLQHNSFTEQKVNKTVLLYDVDYWGKLYKKNHEEEPKLFNNVQMKKNEKIEQEKIKEPLKKKKKKKKNNTGCIFEFKELTPEELKEKEEEAIRDRAKHFIV